MIRFPFYFKDNNWTIWLTAQQYRSLRASFEQRAKDGNPEALRRLKGFGPAPEEALDNA